MVEVTYYPLDTGHKLNVLDVFWTSYVRSIYILCPGGKTLKTMILQFPIPKVIYQDSHGHIDRFYLLASSFM